MTSKTSPVSAWTGEFGDTYTERNAPTPEAQRLRLRMWARLLAAMKSSPPASILEVGANLGLNLRALGQLTDARLRAVEPNGRARASLIADGVVAAQDVVEGIAKEIPLPDAVADLVFTSGVLIHIAPDDLLASCQEIHRLSARYVLSVEYYSNQPETINYRGHDDLLFKRDFGTFWHDNFPDLEIVDYGFFWRVPTGLDNLNWWLFRKTD